MNPSELSDRELDAAVAAEVMGWERKAANWAIGEPYYGPEWTVYKWRPSTDPRAMMEAKLYCARNYGMAVTVITDQCGTICTVTHGAATYSSGVKSPQERECRAVCEGLLLAVRAKGGGDEK